MTKKEEREMEAALNALYALSARVPFKPFPNNLRSRSEWLDLLHRLQNGDATCMFVLNEIGKELDMVYEWHEKKK
jgi:hypothetical protein